jgi:hypothetical protein
MPAKAGSAFHFHLTAVTPAKAGVQLPFADTSE